MGIVFHCPIFIMKRLSILLLLALCLTGIATAQPKWAKKAHRSVFTVKTFNANGSLKASATGFFTGTAGEAVSILSAFTGASKAIVIDSHGKEWPVTSILGADSNYDVIKFRVSARQCPALTIAATAPSVQAAVWLLPYSPKKLKTCTMGKVSKIETAKDSLPYYTLDIQAPDGSGGCPVLNDNGEVAGIFQPSGQDVPNTGYAVSIMLANNLKTNGLSINDAALKAIGIKKELPADLNQALLTLYLAGTALDSTRTKEYSSLVNDFIQQFPTAPDGYISRAQLAAAQGEYARADKDMSEALGLEEKKDNTHYCYARLILQKIILDKDSAYQAWTLDKAADEAQAAYDLNPLPVYLQLKSQIRCTQKKYDEAYTILQSLIAQGHKEADIYCQASQCKELLGDTALALALLDSAVATFSKPWLKAAAPYILARAQAQMRAGNYRVAYSDFNDYEQLMPTEVGAQFYYLRAQAAIGGRMFQQALNDYNKAIAKQPNNTLYYAEKASLEIRVNLLTQAIDTAKACISIAPEQSDGYLLLGLAQCLSGNKVQGKANLKKAQDLGDNQADDLIKQYAQ